MIHDGGDVGFDGDPKFLVFLLEGVPYEVGCKSQH